MHQPTALFTAVTATAALMAPHASGEVVALYDYNNVALDTNDNIPSNVTSSLVTASNQTKDPGGAGNADGMGIIVDDETRDTTPDTFTSNVLVGSAGNTARNPFADPPDALDATQDYITFTLTSLVNGLDFTSFSFDYGASVRPGDSTGFMGAIQLFVDINGGGFTAVGDLQERIVPSGAPGVFTGFTQSVIDLSGLAALNTGDTAEFRMAFGDNSGQTTGNKAHYLDNVTVNAVPEPASLALLGLGGLFIAARRRAA